MRGRRSKMAPYSAADTGHRQHRGVASRRTKSGNPPIVQTETIDALFDRHGPVYKWLATGTCMVATMTMALAGSTVTVAFPEIMGAFGIGRDQAALLSTGYFAAQTAGMLLSAWFIEVIGEPAP